MYGISTLAKLVIRVVFLALIESYGQKLNIKSKMTAEGDLVIYGCDDTGKQVFSYTMQEQYRRSDKIQISEGSDNED